MICPPELYYAQPYFHLPDGYAAQLLERIEAGKGTQRDFDLAASFGMFGLEGYFTEAERDAALGATASPVCRYAAVSLEDAQRALKNLPLSCPYRADHPRFGEAIGFVLPQILSGLVKEDETMVTIGRVLHQVALRPENSGGAMLNLHVEVIERFLPPYTADLIARTRDALFAATADMLMQALGSTTRFTSSGSA